MEDTIYPERITDLIPLLGKAVWVQTGGYTADAPEADHYREATLRTVMADDMGAWVIVEWPDGAEERYPWFRVRDRRDPLPHLTAIFDEAVKAGFPRYRDTGF